MPFEQRDRRPAVGTDRFRVGPISDATRDALKKLGGLCDGCGIGSVARRATLVTTNMAGARVALCDDCRDELRMNRIAAHIHRR